MYRVVSSLCSNLVSPIPSNIHVIVFISVVLVLNVVLVFSYSSVENPVDFVKVLVLS